MQKRSQKGICHLYNTIKIDSGPKTIRNAVQCLGYHKLRPNQLEVRSFVERRDVFLALPTRSGKSLCNVVLQSAFDELTSQKGSIVIVVSIKQVLESCILKSV